MKCPNCNHVISVTSIPADDRYFCSQCKTETRFASCLTSVNDFMFWYAAKNGIESLLDSNRLLSYAKDLLPRLKDDLSDLAAALNGGMVQYLLDNKVEFYQKNDDIINSMISKLRNEQFMSAEESAKTAGYFVSALGWDLDPESGRAFQDLLFMKSTEELIKMAKAYAMGYDKPRDYQKVKQCLKAAADKGSVYAMRAMGKAIQCGLVDDDITAVQWYTRAVNQGSAIAEGDLFQYYLSRKQYDELDSIKDSLLSKGIMPVILATRTGWAGHESSIDSLDIGEASDWVLEHLLPFRNFESIEAFQEKCAQIIHCFSNEEERIQYLTAFAFGAYILCEDSKDFNLAEWKEYYVRGIENGDLLALQMHLIYRNRESNISDAAKDSIERYLDSLPEDCYEWKEFFKLELFESDNLDKFIALAQQGNEYASLHVYDKMYAPTNWANIGGFDPLTRKEIESMIRECEKHILIKPHVRKNLIRYIRDILMTEADSYVSKQRVMPMWEDPEMCHRFISMFDINDIVNSNYLCSRILPFYTFKRKNLDYVMELLEYDKKCENKNSLDYGNDIRKLMLFDRWTVQVFIGILRIVYAHCYQTGSVSRALKIRNMVNEHIGRDNGRHVGCGGALYLMYIYCFGDGVKQSYSRAKEFYDLALADTKKYLDPKVYAPSSARLCWTPGFAVSADAVSLAEALLLIKFESSQSEIRQSFDLRYYIAEGIIAYEKQNYPYALERFTTVIQNENFKHAYYQSDRMYLFYYMALTFERYVENKERPHLVHAKLYFEQSCLLGLLDAIPRYIYQVASNSSNPSISKEKYQELFNILGVCASHGYAIAYLAEHLMIENGHVIDNPQYQNSDQKDRFLRRAYELGVPEAKDKVHLCLAYGHAYMLGEYGLPKDIKKGFQYYYTAAYCGHPVGKQAAGLFLLKGAGDLIPKDTVKGERWLREAIAEGDYNALDTLLSYYDEMGALNTVALELFNKVQNWTDIEHKARAAVIYLQYKSLIDEASILLFECAETGNGLACANYAVYLYQHSGLDAAYEYARKAQQAGFENAATKSIINYARIQEEIQSEKRIIADSKKELGTLGFFAGRRKGELNAQIKKSEEKVQNLERTLGNTVITASYA